MKRFVVIRCSTYSEITLWIILTELNFFWWQQNLEEEIEIKEEKCEFFVDDFEDDVEVIEVKMEDEEIENILYDVADIENQLVDIANIPINDDATSELIVPDDTSVVLNSLKEKTLDNEELAILEKDLKTTTPGYEHLVE